MHRGESADPLQLASGGPGQFSTQRSYKVYSDKVSVAGILRQSDCAAEEHEHPEAQLSILFRGNAASLLTHDESGKTTKTGIVAESFIFVAPGQPHRVNWKNDGEVLHLWMPNEVLRELSEQSRCPIPSTRLGDRPDRGVYEIGRILMDEFKYASSAESVGCFRFRKASQRVIKG